MELKFFIFQKNHLHAERIANFENTIGENIMEIVVTKLFKFLENQAYKKNSRKFNKVSKKIEKIVSVVQKLRNGGVHGANFAVLRGFNGTGVLIELGFVSNSYDAAILVDEDSQHKMAEEIAKSIKEYLTR